MYKKLVSITLVFILAVGLSNSINAAPTGGKFEMYVTKSGQYTGYNLKESTSQSFDFNVYNMGGTHNFWFVMQNSDNRNRSDVEKVIDDVENRVFTQWGTKGYSYKVKIGRENKLGDYSNIYIRGDWNPR